MARRYGRVKHYARHAGMRGLGSLVPVISGALYGAVRQPLAEKIPNIDALGGYSDEVILGGGALLANALIPSKLVRSIAKPIIYVEAARMGEKIRTGVTGASSGSSGLVYH